MRERKRVIRFPDCATHASVWTRGAIGSRLVRPAAVEVYILSTHVLVLCFSGADVYSERVSDCPRDEPWDSEAGTAPG